MKWDVKSLWMASRKCSCRLAKHKDSVCRGIDGLPRRCARDEKPPTEREEALKWTSFFVLKIDSHSFVPKTLISELLFSSDW